MQSFLGMRPQTLSKNEVEASPVAGQGNTKDPIPILFLPFLWINIFQQ